MIRFDSVQVVKLVIIIIIYPIKTVQQLIIAKVLSLIKTFPSLWGILSKVNMFQCWLALLKTLFIAMAKAVKETLERIQVNIGTSRKNL